MKSGFTNKVLLLQLFISFGLAGCTNLGMSGDRESDRQKIKSELGGEVSLAADRSQLDELRKEIPEGQQKKNDELALYLGLMKQGKERPETVRNKFTSMVQERRNVYRDKVKKLRDQYSDQERKRRENFLNEQKSDRESYMKKKATSAENREYFSEQDKERRSYFADERSRRQAFESEIRSQSADFESYMREKNNEFNEQYRLYVKNYEEVEKEAKKAKAEQIKTQSSGGFDFKQLESTPAEHLGVED